MRLATLVLLLVSVSACDSVADAEPTFGDAYRVLTDPAPLVADGAVTAVVEYGGGCEEHDFVLRSRDIGDAVEVWFVHDARGDTCEAIVRDTLTASLPGAAVTADVLTLNAPSGERIALR